MTTKTNHPTQQLVMLPNTYLRLCVNVQCDVVLYDATLTQRCTCLHTGETFGARWNE